MDKDEFENTFNDSIPDAKCQSNYNLLNELNNQDGSQKYSETIKNFSLLIRLKAGRDVHEILSGNLPLPKTSTADKYLANFDVIIEGELQIKGLIRHFEETGCTQNDRKVWIAEDATSIISRVEYMPSTGQIVGFVPKIVPGTGMPALHSFPATSLSAVKNYFDEHKKSKSVYALVAVPLNSKASAYILSVFGTTNQFTSEEVLDR